VIGGRRKKKITDDVVEIFVFFVEVHLYFHQKPLQEDDLRGIHVGED